jgi:hypothetical protein
VPESARRKPDDEGTKVNAPDDEGTKVNAPDEPADRPAPDPTLTDRQQQALLAMLSCGTLRGAARSAKVGYSTLREWLKAPTFREALTQARLEALAAAALALQGGAAEAVAVLRKGLKSGDAATRLKAADTFLKHVSAITEMLDIAELRDRIQEVEEEQKGRRPAGY